MAFYSANQLAAAAGVSRPTIQRKAAQIPGVERIGSRWRFRRIAALERWIDDRNPPGEWFKTAEMAKLAGISTTGICFLADKIPGARKRGPRKWIFERRKALEWIATRKTKAVKKLETISGKGSVTPPYQSYLDGMERWLNRIGGEETVLAWPEKSRRDFEERMRPFLKLAIAVAHSLKGESTRLTYGTR